MAPPWLDGLRAVIQPIAGAVPALLIVLFAGLLALLGLACEPGRRAYAIAYADRLVDLAAVIVDRNRNPSQPRRRQRDLTR